MNRHARRSSPLPRLLPVLAAFAVLGLGAWTGSYLRSPDAEMAGSAPAAVPTTRPASPSTPPSTPGTPAASPGSPAASPGSAAPPPPTTEPPTTEPAPPPADPGVVAFEQEVVALVNAERAQAGCTALAEDARLAIAARAHSTDMAVRGYFDHTTPDGVTFDKRIESAGYSWSYVAENIARGQRDPAAVMDAWMNSDGHRRNILNCNLRHIGVGLAYDDGNRPYWTQDFGTPR